MMTPEAQMPIICKGVCSLVNEETLLAKLREDRPLVIKLGLDPSAPDIHLGHTVVLRKIKQMQDLGHRAVIVIGDFTGKIGDPTGKSKTRKALTDEQVKANAATYFEQIFKILDRDKTEVRYNSEWLAKLNFEDVIRLASTITVARMLERDDFQNRYQHQQPIGLHEFFYPLMQAYDSVELQADIELGGMDQTFNILMGRSLQKDMGQPQQAALFMPLLVGLDGVEKMSKSLGNYIGVSEPPEVMFKKVMEVPDALVIEYFNLVTDEHPDTVKQLEQALADGAHPRDIKLKLAQTVTRLYHGEKATARAQAYFEAAFSRKSIPDTMPEYTLSEAEQTLNDLVPALKAMGLIQSRSAWLRLLQQQGVQLNGSKLSAEDAACSIHADDVLRIGKKRFLRLV